MNSKQLLSDAFIHSLLIIIALNLHLANHLLNIPSIAKCITPEENFCKLFCLADKTFRNCGINEKSLK